MQTSNLVSVIIPTFNRTKFVQRAIQSVLNQTYKNFEIIIIDDGSTDSTEADLKAFPIHYFKTKNLGVSSARNLGVSLAKGNWLAFLDSDDLWHATKLEKQLSYSILNPELKLVHTEEAWIRNGIRVNKPNKYRKAGGDQFNSSLKLCAISPSTVLMDKELFNQLGKFREDYPCCEDYDLWLKYTSLYSVGFIDEELTHKFGGHDDQLSFKYIAMDFWRIKSLIWILENRALTEERKSLLLSVLKKKCEVLIKGYQKHNNLENLGYVQEVFNLHFVR